MVRTFLQHPECSPKVVSSLLSQEFPNRHTSTQVIHQGQSGTLRSLAAIRMDQTPASLVSHIKEAGGLCPKRSEKLHRLPAGMLENKKHIDPHGNMQNPAKKNRKILG